MRYEVFDLIEDIINEIYARNDRDVEFDGLHMNERELDDDDEWHEVIREEKRFWADELSRPAVAEFHGNMDFGDSSLNIAIEATMARKLGKHDLTDIEVDLLNKVVDFYRTCSHGLTKEFEGFVEEIDRLRDEGIIRGKEGGSRGKMRGLE